MHRSMIFQENKLEGQNNLQYNLDWKEYTTIQKNQLSNSVILHSVICFKTKKSNSIGLQSFKDNMINVDSTATSNACSTSMANPQSGPLTPQFLATEYIHTWYMHHIIDPPDHNQVTIADPEEPEMFGYTIVHDYPIYDSLGPDKNIVGRAQGLHSKTSMNNGGSWFHWTKVVFDYER